MFGIIGRGIVMILMWILVLPVFIFTIIVGIIMTLFNGIKYGDWCQEVWAEGRDEVISLCNQTIKIILNK